MSKRSEFESAYPSDLRNCERKLLDQRRIDAELGEAPFVGLALSGGGIRSATFGLGLLRALAKARLLRRVDFLSTVSGGGYIGSFLGALFARPEAAGVGAGTRVEAVETALADRDSGLLHWLRENGRYLSPNGAGDTQLAAGVMLRNWVSVQVVIAIALLTWFVAMDLANGLLPQSLAAGFVQSAGAFGPIWWSAWIALPFVVSALWVVPTAWAYWLLPSRGRSWIASMASVPLVIFLVGEASDPAWAALRHPSARWSVALQSFVLVAAIATPIVYRIVRCRAPGNEARKLSVWLKSGLVVASALLVLALLDAAGQTLYLQIETSEGLWKRLAAIPAAVGAVVPFALKLQALLKKDPPPKRSSLPLSALALVGALLLAVVFAVTMATIGDAIHWRGDAPRLSSAANEIANYPGTAAKHLLDLALLLILGVSVGHAFSFLNESTHAPLYSARLRRAYLGASNPKRHEHGTTQGVTSDVPGDELSLAEYFERPRGGPLHLLNVTLNETIGGMSQVEQRDRRGLGMAFGPAGLSVGVRHHALWAKTPGDFEHGLTPLPVDGGFVVFAVGEQKKHFEPEPLSLSRIVAISGAAVSTGLGSRTSLGLSLLLGLLNLRLGHWWLSGIDPREREAASRRAAAEDVAAPRAVPTASLGVWRRLGGVLSRTIFPVQVHLLQELLARFPGPASRNWYLSDGGHFENSGCYELIRRRLPLIVVSDCGADPEYEFSDFAQLVRKARLDFGATIRPLDPVRLTRIDPAVRRYFVSDGELRRRRTHDERMAVDPAAAPLERFAPVDEQRRWNGGHAMIFEVEYANDPERRSILLWIKPSLIGDEPPDLLNYGLEHPTFPQESTADQYFDEAQWESYQKLGELIGDRIFAVDGATPSRSWHPHCLDPMPLL